MTHPFRSYEEAFRLNQEQERSMAAPNAQPARRGGMKAPNTHATHSGAGTNNGVGDGKGGAVKRTDSSSKGKSPKNKNRLH